MDRCSDNMEFVVDKKVCEPVRFARPYRKRDIYVLYRAEKVDKYTSKYVGRFSALVYLRTCLPIYIHMAFDEKYFSSHTYANITFARCRPAHPAAAAGTV